MGYKYKHVYTDRKGPMFQKWGVKSRSVKTFRGGYYQAKKNWRGNKFYNKASIQRQYNYSKVPIRGRGAPRGMVTSGALGRGFRTKSLLTDNLPKSGGQIMKFKDNKWNQASQLVRASNQILEPISEGTGISRGDSHDARNGNKVHVKRLDIRGNFGWPAHNGSTQRPQGRGQIKMFVVVDTQTNKTLMDVDDFLSGSVADDFTKRFYNVASGRRFKVLFEKTYNIPKQDSNPVNDDVIPASSVQVDESIDVRGYPITYAYSSTGEVGQITENNIYVIFGANEPDGVHPGITQHTAYDLATRVWWGE